MLRIKNFSKRYNNTTILDDITISVTRNTIVGLAGPSGSGKSTLLRCIQKLESGTSGEMVCNVETGFMFQDFQLFPHMNVIQNLKYASMLNKIENTEYKALDLLKRLNILHKKDSYPSQLSGGQKQRVALARTLMLHPSLLLCDEPTSGLDFATISDVVLLLESIKSMNITMIIASHDLDFLVKIADRIILLKDGKVAVDLQPQGVDEPIKLLQRYY